MDDAIITNNSDWAWTYSVADDGSLTPTGETYSYTLGVGTPGTYDPYHSGYSEYVFSNNSDGSIKVEKKDVEVKKNHLWKYTEDKILKDIEDYVTSTYGSHYCGNETEYKDIQTIDLMAAKGLAPGFCQANILKYGSRYGSKDGRNKRDLMKVIHYAMLLLHFDGHYTRKNNGISEFR